MSIFFQGPAWALLTCKDESASLNKVTDAHIPPVCEIIG
jgi:hypothetical protein